MRLLLIDVLHLDEIDPGLPRPRTAVRLVAPPISGINERPTSLFFSNRTEGEGARRCGSTGIVGFFCSQNRTAGEVRVDDPATPRAAFSSSIPVGQSAAAGCGDHGGSVPSPPGRTWAGTTAGWDRRASQVSHPMKFDGLYFERFVERDRHGISVYLWLSFFPILIGCGLLAFGFLVDMNYVLELNGLTPKLGGVFLCSLSVFPLQELLARRDRINGIAAIWEAQRACFSEAREDGGARLRALTWRLYEKNAWSRLMISEEKLPSQSSFLDDLERRIARQGRRAFWRTIFLILIPVVVAAAATDTFIDRYYEIKFGGVMIDSRGPTITIQSSRELSRNSIVVATDEGFKVYQDQDQLSRLLSALQASKD